MTRKHFKLIARALRAARPSVEGLDVHANCALALADALAATNPSFDRERFLRACGVTEGERMIGDKPLSRSRHHELEDLIDASMCAWEYVLSELSGGNNKWTARRDLEGTSALRHHVLNMAEVIHSAYGVAVKAGFDESFDWEFVPEFLSRATDADCNLVRGWNEIAKLIGQEHGRL